VLRQDKSMNVQAASIAYSLHYILLFLSTIIDVKTHRLKNITMASQIHVIRHAESVHNVSKDFSQLDPSLTSLGFEQATKLDQSFPYAGRVGVIITSPLRRAIQTTHCISQHP
tara:strand:+ start:1829 stop:2167 length:339 start_codon:yes stop_codon:yes gene_type:complete